MRIVRLVMPLLLVGFVFFNLVWGNYVTTMIVAWLFGLYAAVDQKLLAAHREVVEPEPLQPIEVKPERCQHELESVYVEFRPGVPTLVSRVCTKCLAVGRVKGRKTGWLE